MTEDSAQTPEQPTPADPVGPPQPAVWLVVGLVIGVIGAVTWLVGLHKAASQVGQEDTLVPAVGLLVLALGGIVSIIGAVGLGVQLALARRDWERSRPGG